LQPWARRRADSDRAPGEAASASVRGSNDDPGLQRPFSLRVLLRPACMGCSTGGCWFRSPSVGRAREPGGRMCPGARRCVHSACAGIGSGERRFAQPWKPMRRQLPPWRSARQSKRFAPGFVVQGDPVGTTGFVPPDVAHRRPGSRSGPKNGHPGSARQRPSFAVLSEGEDACSGSF